MIYRILRKGKVRVNKRRVRPHYKLIVGDKIRIPPIQIIKNDKEQMSSLFLRSLLTNNYNNILYEDNYILVLNKPSGIAVHSGSGLKKGIIEELRTLFPEKHFLELVHRIDRHTSGVLLIAKKRSALHSLHEQIREKKIQKEYLALVKGKWQSDIKIIHVPLLKKTLQNGKHIILVSKNGKDSKTLFNIEERYKFSTLLRCYPITGRTHQIRVHTKYAGHPIALDNYYGNYKFNKQLVSLGLNRLFLHAESLKFMHPNTNKTMHIKAPLDKQLTSCLEILRKPPNSKQL